MDNRSCATRYFEAYRDHLETWGPHCGAPKSVFQGHLEKLLEAHLYYVAELCSMTAAESIKSRFRLSEEQK